MLDEARVRELVEEAAEVSWLEGTWQLREHKVWAVSDDQIMLDAPRERLIATVYYLKLRDLIAAAPELAQTTLDLYAVLEGVKPLLQAAVDYHHARAHSAHALPGSKDRDQYDLAAGDALYRLRGSDVQRAAHAALAQPRAGAEGAGG